MRPNSNEVCNFSLYFPCQQRIQRPVRTRLRRPPYIPDFPRHRDTRSGGVNSRVFSKTCAGRRSGAVARDALGTESRAHLGPISLDPTFSVRFGSSWFGATPPKAKTPAVFGGSPEVDRCGSRFRRIRRSRAVRTSSVRRAQPSRGGRRRVRAAGCRRRSP